VAEVVTDIAAEAEKPESREPHIDSAATATELSAYRSSVGERSAFEGEFSIAGFLVKPEGEGVSITRRTGSEPGESVDTVTQPTMIGLERAGSERTLMVILVPLSVEMADADQAGKSEEPDTQATAEEPSAGEEASPEE
jgi:hypothetical protein